MRAEWIIVDNESHDSTRSVIAQYSGIVNQFICEKDSGIYDAWNKALSVSTGEWILFLGAGDAFCSPSAIEMILPELDPLYPICYSNVLLYSPLGDLISTSGSVDVGAWDQLRPFLPHHQGCFHNRRHLALLPFPVFDPSYRIGGDTKVLIQLLQHGSFKHINQDAVAFVADGISSDPANLSLIAKEHIRIIDEVEGYSPPAFYLRHRDLVLYLKICLYRLCGSRIYEKTMRLFGKNYYTKQ